MKKIVISLMAIVSVFMTVGCVDISKDSNNVNTTDSYNTTNNNGATGGAEEEFKTVFNVTCEEVKADGGVLTIVAETLTGDLPNEFVLTVLGEKYTPVTEYTSYETVKFNEEIIIGSNDSDADVTIGIKLVAMDAVTVVVIGEGECIQISNE